jgi:hypothetical protein
VHRDSLGLCSVLSATHKYFIPPSNQQCQIPLEEDVLIEIFQIKTKRAKPVIYLQTNKIIIFIYLFI